MTTTAWCSVDTKADCSTIVAKYLRTAGASQAPLVLVADRLPQVRERVDLSGTSTATGMRERGPSHMGLMDHEPDAVLLRPRGRKGRVRGHDHRCLQCCFVLFCGS